MTVFNTWPEMCSTDPVPNNLRAKFERHQCHCKVSHHIYEIGKYTCQHQICVEITQIYYLKRLERILKLKVRKKKLKEENIPTMYNMQHIMGTV
jgi:hypothetical protein